MTIIVLIVYLLSSLGLFFLLNYVEKNKKNYEVIHFGFISGIYLLFVSGMINDFGIDKSNNLIIIIFLLELVIRIFYVNVIQEDDFFKDINLVKRYLFSFILIFLLNNLFVSKVNSVFLSMDQVKIILWIFILFYIMYFYKNDFNGGKKYKNKKFKKNPYLQQKEYNILKYAKFKNSYSNYVKTRYSLLLPVIYAIMIYENKRRPFMFRKLDYMLYRLLGKGRKFGIMQIYSNYYIDDVNSISIATRKLEKIYYNHSNDRNIERVILREYYHKDYIAKEVMKIVRDIRDFDKK